MFLNPRSSDQEGIGHMKIAPNLTGFGRVIRQSDCFYAFLAIEMPDGVVSKFCKSFREKFALSGV